MKSQEKESIVGETLQKTVCRLISEEYFAYQFYLLARMAIDREYARMVDDLFTEIGRDELEDHMKNLVQWACEYRCDIPCSETEFKRHAGKKIVNIVKEMKKGKDAEYYIQEAIKSEKLAIESYDKAVHQDDIGEFTDLQSLLWNIYYDEQEHLQKLGTALIACQADVDLVM